MRRAPAVLLLASAAAVLFVLAGYPDVWADVRAGMEPDCGGKAAARSGTPWPQEREPKGLRVAKPDRVVKWEPPAFLHWG